MKKITVLLSILLFAGITLHAQKTAFGIMVGPSFSNFTVKESGTKMSASSNTGITGGFFVDIPASSHFSIRPALNYVQKGWELKEDIGKYKTTVNALEVPIHLLYNSRGEAGNFFAGAGPSFAFILSGKDKFTSSDPNFPSETTDLSIGNSNDDDFRGFDFGADIMAGYSFPNGLTLAANYNQGFSNLIPGDTDGASAKSHYFAFKVGWIFGSKKVEKKESK